MYGNVCYTSHVDQKSVSLYVGTAKSIVITAADTPVCFLRFYRARTRYIIHAICFRRICIVVENRSLVQQNYYFFANFTTIRHKFSHYKGIFLEKDATAAFQNLDPDTILDAVESRGFISDGRILALNSYENRVYRIGLESSQPVVVKFYRPNRWSDEAILEDHKFSEELQEAELPVVAPLSIDATTLHHLGPYRFTLYPLHGGRAPELDNPHQLEIIGRFIARMHLIGETKAFHFRPELSLQRLGRDSVSFLCDGEHLPSAIRASYTAIASELLDCIEQRFDAHGEITQLRIHGDFHPGNLLWRDDIPNIVDLDDCCRGPSIQDLWMFLSGDRRYQSERLSDLLFGYEEFREFDRRELALIEPLRALRQIYYAAWVARRWEDPAFQLAFPWFASASYWDNHILSLREQRAAFDEPYLVV